MKRVTTYGNSHGWARVTTETVGNMTVASTYGRTAEPYTEGALNASSLLFWDANGATIDLFELGRSGAPEARHDEIVEMLRALPTSL